MANTTAEIYNFIANLYQTELKEIAEKLEKKRKIFVLVYKIFTIIAIGLSILIVLAAIILMQNVTSNPNMAGGDSFELLLCAGGLIFTIVAFIWGLRTVIFNIYAHEVKEKLFKKIYQAIDKNLTYFPGKLKLPVRFFDLEMLLGFLRNNLDTAILAETQIRKLNILPPYDYIKVDDVIMGNYCGRPVKIIEFILIEKRIYHTSKGHRRTTYVEIFKGALFQTTMEKQLKTNVFIKQKGSPLRCPRGLAKVNLESNEFEQIYDVFSSDQIESRYFLNTSTMQNLIDLYNAGQKLSGYIQGNSLNILIHSTQDMFEPDINKPLNNPNNYFELIFQAKVILDIITKLNLESKTGL